MKEQQEAQEEKGTTRSAILGSVIACGITGGLIGGMLSEIGGTDSEVWIYFFLYMVGGGVFFGVSAGFVLGMAIDDSKRR